MKIINLIQGSHEWHQHRAIHFNASDAPAMMGCSSYKNRTQLLKEIKTGIAQDIDAATQHLFDDGHRFEALARKLAEDIIGEEFYPVTGTNGKLSASFDGLTIMEDVAFEHKTLNDTLRSIESVDQLPRQYKVQMEQQLFVSGAGKCLFMASKWSESGELIEERHFWYEADDFLRRQIIDGWDQFAIDLESHEIKPVEGKIVAESVMQLPALSIQVGGSISIQSNLVKFGERLKSFVEETNSKPETDLDFANLEQACKVLKDAEDALKQAESNALAQTASVDEMRRTVAYLVDIARTNRLQFEKLVKSEKDNIKVAINLAAAKALGEHLQALKAEIKGVELITPPVFFAEAIKGKKTLSSMQDAVDTMLANAKIAAGIVAKDVRVKLAWCKETSNGYGFLFNDLQTLIQKPEDDFKLAVTSRIKEHQEAERIKAEQAEKERIEREARLIKEAEERATREAEAKLRAEQAEKDRLALEAKQAEELAEREILERENQEILEQSVKAKSENTQTVDSNPDDAEYSAVQPIVTAKKNIETKKLYLDELADQFNDGKLDINQALFSAYQYGKSEKVAA